jgi:hypothetical protein
VGGNLAYLQESAFNDNGFRGRLVFDGSQLGHTLTPDFAEGSLIDLLAGLPAPGTTAIARGDTQRYLRQHRVSAFVGDRHRWGNRLSLSMGLRYDYFSVPTEARGRLSNFLPDAGLVTVGSPQLPSLYQPRRLDFAPRLGLALQVSSSRTLEAGYGFYFSAAPFEQYLDNSANPNTVLAGPMFNPIGSGAIFTITPAAPIPFGPGVPIFGSAAPQPPFDLFAVSTSLHDPRSQNYYLNIVQKLGQAADLRLGYFGTAARRLPVVLDVNAPLPGAAGVTNEQARRPYVRRFPTYKVIDTVSDISYSNYNSFQISLETLGSHGLTAKASYTWSKWLDLNSSGSGTRSGYPQNPRDPGADYGLSDYDTPQRLTLTFSYVVPTPGWLHKGWWLGLMRNWEMNGIATLQSGKPFNVTLPSDNSGTGEFADRPYLIGDPFLPFNPTGPYLNPAAFSRPPEGSYGNLGRNVFRSPGLSNIDYSMVRLFNLDSARSIRVRAEFFNLINHPNFSDPSATFGSGFRLTSTPDNTNPYFGAGGPRNIQLVAELLF